MKITKSEAWGIFCKYNKQEKLLRHAISVGACMRYFAEKLGEDVEKWEAIGILHDIDFELYPEQHCIKCVEILETEGFNQDWIHSIQSHGWQIVPNDEKEPQHIMEKILYTVDQLSGLVVAVALMRPSKSLDDLTAKSVVKKWKDKHFAAGVSREVISVGIEMLNMERREVIEGVIMGLIPVQESLGLVCLNSDK